MASSGVTVHGIMGCRSEDENAYFVDMKLNTMKTFGNVHITKVPLFHELLQYVSYSEIYQCPIVLHFCLYTIISIMIPLLLVFSAVQLAVDDTLAPVIQPMKNNHKLLEDLFKSRE
jgi:hypothetical protein